MRAIQHDDDPRLQGIDANRAGSAFKDEDGKSSVSIAKSANLHAPCMMLVGRLYGRYAGRPWKSHSFMAQKWTCDYRGDMLSIYATD